jgi:hypothetical protein
MNKKPRVSPRIRLRIAGSKAPRGGYFVTMTVKYGSHAKDDEWTYETEQALDLEWLAGLYSRHTVEQVEIIAYDMRIASKWPSEWSSATHLVLAVQDIPPEIVNNPLAYVQLWFKDDIPPFAADIRRKCSAGLYINQMPKEYPAHWRFLCIESSHGVDVCVFKRPFYPLSAPRIYRNSWYMSQGGSCRHLCVLYALLQQGLPRTSAFRRWLTQGLYDPRLLQTIARFLCDSAWTKFPLSSSTKDTSFF